MCHFCTALCESDCREREKTHPTLPKTGTQILINPFTQKGTICRRYSQSYTLYRREGKLASKQNNRNQVNRQSMLHRSGRTALDWRPIKGLPHGVSSL